VIIKVLKDSVTPHTLRETIQHPETDIHISQGSVATHLRHGGIFTDHFIANLLLSVSVKKIKNGQHLIEL